MSSIGSQYCRDLRIAALVARPLMSTLHNKLQPTVDPAQLAMGAPSGVAVGQSNAAELYRQPGDDALDQTFQEYVKSLVRFCRRFLLHPMTYAWENYGAAKVGAATSWVCVKIDSGNERANGITLAGNKI